MAGPYTYSVEVLKELAESPLVAAPKEMVSIEAEWLVAGNRVPHTTNRRANNAGRSGHGQADKSNHSLYANSRGGPHHGHHGSSRNRHDELDLDVLDENIWDSVDTDGAAPDLQGGGVLEFEQWKLQQKQAALRDAGFEDVSGQTAAANNDAPDTEFSSAETPSRTPLAAGSSASSPHGDGSSAASTPSGGRRQVDLWESSQLPFKASGGGSSRFSAFMGSHPPPGFPGYPGQYGQPGQHPGQHGQHGQHGRPGAPPGAPPGAVPGGAPGAPPGLGRDNNAKPTPPPGLDQQSSKTTTKDDAFFGSLLSKGGGLSPSPSNQAGDSKSASAHGLPSVPGGHMPPHMSMAYNPAPHQGIPLALFGGPGGNPSGGHGHPGTHPGAGAHPGAGGPPGMMPAYGLPPGLMGGPGMPPGLAPQGFQGGHPQNAAGSPAKRT